MIRGVVSGVMVAAVVTLAVLVAVAAPASAHTEVQSAEPGPAAEVSGPVDQVTLTFLDPIRPGGTIEVSGPSGDIEPTSTVTLDDSARVLQLNVEPVDEPGDYVVRYAFTALDGDRQDESYRFRIVEAEGTVPVGAVIAGGAVILVVALAVWRRRSTP